MSVSGLEVAVGAGVALEASRSGFDVGMPVYARDVLGPGASTEFYAALHVGQGAAMLLLSGGGLGGLVSAPLAFGALAAAYATLALLPSSLLLLSSSTPVLGAVAVLGFGTALASVSTTVLLQLRGGRGGPGRTAARSHLHAAYRVAGILTRIVLPVLIGMSLEARPKAGGGDEAAAAAGGDAAFRHVRFFGALAAFLAVFAAVAQAYACWFGPKVGATTSDRIAEPDNAKSTSSSASSASSTAGHLKWRRIWAYCIAVSLPNTAGGIVRSLLGVRLLEGRASESTTFFSNTHAVAQCGAMLAVICVSAGVVAGPRNRTWWRVLLLQAGTMVLTSCAMGMITSSSVAVSVLFVVFRAAEESAKLSNTMLLGGLCENLQHPAGSEDERGTADKIGSVGKKAALLAKAVALQKTIGSVLKICSSLLCSISVRTMGVNATLLMGSGVCALGAAWIAKIMPVAVAAAVKKGKAQKSE